MIANIVWGAPDWIAPATVLAITALGLVAWSYWRASAGSGLVGVTAALLKIVGIAALAVCLLEPLFHGNRAKPGANLFVVLADNSESLSIHDGAGRNRTRAEIVSDELRAGTGWQARLGQDFDLRRYEFDSQLRSVPDFASMSLDGASTSLYTSLDTLARRYENRPLAGILLFSDGNATDGPEVESEGRSLFDAAGLPPIYPVIPGGRSNDRDVRVEKVTVSQTNFEQAPVELRVDVTARGYDKRQILLQVLDEEGTEVERAVVEARAEEPVLTHRFRVRPVGGGVHFYQVRAVPEAEEAAWKNARKSREATLANNSRMVAVNRKEGPYRILYVAGRPNWEFKFIRRALEEDHEVEFTGLVRIAKEEPRFEFMDRSRRSSNPLFRGAEDAKEEQTERYDEPVILRLGVREAEELRSGFPKTVDELYSFDALVLDDLEAEFFTRDQMTMVNNFVSRRGGGLLMLGGQESFATGEYDRTPIGEMLPIYVDDSTPPSGQDNYHMALTREGWLQPWVRLRATEDDESRRLDSMPKFQIVNNADRIKPGATVLAHVTDDKGVKLPALAMQQFGRGRVGAWLIGDLWRWRMRSDEENAEDLPKTWRQTLRWLVADVPRRVDMEVQRRSGAAHGTVAMRVEVRDEKFLPLDNAGVDITVTTPEKEEVRLTGAPSADSAGTYVATFAPRVPGVYRARAEVRGADNAPLGERTAGWTTEPRVREFESIDVNRQGLGELARQTGGQVVDTGDLGWFVADLPNRKVPIDEPWTFPIWHSWYVFAFAVACLIGEWGIRRWKGLA